MNNKKIFFISFTALLLVFLLTFSPHSENNVFAEEIKDENETTIITDPEALKPFKEKYGEEEGKELTSVTIVENRQEDLLSNLATPAASSAYKLKNKKKTEACGVNEIRRSTFSAPGGIMSISESIDATWSASGGVSAKVVSAELGFSVSKKHGVSDSQNISVPKGKSKTVKAYPEYDIWNYSVYKGSKKKGSGYAQKPAGVCFVQYTNK